MSEITIYTLARELNMTPSMVSRAFSPKGRISEEKRKLVLAAAKKYNFSPNRFASRLSMKTVSIGVLIGSRFAVNTDKMISGIQSAYDKLKDYKIKYDITVLNPEVSSSEDFGKALLRYGGCDGVILSGMSASKYCDIIKELYDLNPNIVQVQAVNKDVPCLFASKHNEETASCMAAEFLHNCLRLSRGKNILLFTGDMDSTLHKAARSAFEKACREYGLCLLDSIDMKDNEEYFAGIIPEVFEKYRAETEGIYITSGFSAPLCRFMEENGISVPFVSFDTYKDIKEYMAKGIIWATVAQNVENQMENAFEMLVEAIITGESVPKTVYTDVQLVLKSNMHQFC